MVLKIRILVLALLFCGCGEKAVVLSSDGNKQIAFCNDENWTKCVSEACPYGFDVIMRSSASHGIIKCKPGER